ncbi:MAG: leucyl/phenylalanyl-tRNA--protein transferase [Pseudomonas sp.]|nr:leucyl/phenylalanyl-tRNA--protein transferase [Pseudomonas sp.]
MPQLTWLRPDSLAFPNPERALSEPEGLLAAGGDLSPERLINAYRQGIFPWYQDGQPLLWWSPNPRTVLRPARLHVSRSMRKFMRNTDLSITLDRNFAEVIKACAQPRAYTDGTWITEEMQRAYCRLHQLNVAHSVEVRDGHELVGGLYGVALGKVFFGESMFSRRSNTSKAAFIFLVEHLHAWGYELIDCQMPTEHLFSLGAESISRAAFIDQLRLLCPETAPSLWRGNVL